MATSIKLSELQSLANLTLSDLLLVTDAETSTSRKISFQNLRDSFNLTEIPGYDSYNTQVVSLVSDETTARETAVAALQSLIDSLTTEANARNTRITTLETTVDNLDIDFAPETLNSISELADAMGGDPTFLTTLQSRVTTIENDNATQTELDEYKAHIEARNLEAGLATGVLYADTIYGG